MGRRDIAKEKIVYIKWLDLTPDQRTEQSMPRTVEAFGRTYNVSVPTLVKWKKEIHYLRDHQAPTEFEEFKEHLKKKALNPQAKAGEMELYADIMGWRIKRIEEKITIDLNADFIAKAIFGVVGELNQAGFSIMEGKRVVEVSPESNLLPA